MAIKVETSQPQALLDAIKKAIREGHIDTWKYDNDGDFTHTPTQWVNKCWLRPRVQSGSLVFTTLPPKNAAITTEVYAVYHGRFIEMLLAHFDTQFTGAGATAQPTGDLVGATA
jgi:hypothetical protein